MSILSPLSIGLAVGVALILGGVLLLFLRQSIIVKLGLRNIPRRPSQSILIVIGLTLSTTIIISALSIGDTLDYSVRRSAVEAYGQIDLVISPPFLRDLLALANDGPIDPNNAADSPDANVLNALTAGDLSSVLALFENGLPGIDQTRYDTLRAQLADEPTVDGVAGSIVFPTILRDVNSGQGEPLGFLVAVDDNYDREFGLHTIDGRPVQIQDLQPGVGNIFAAAQNLFNATEQLIGNAGSAVGLQDVGVTEAAVTIAAVGALLTADPAPTITLDSLRLDVATLRALGFDTSALEAQGIETLSLETLGLTDEQLQALGIDPSAPITLPTLQTLGLTTGDPAAVATNLLSGVNLNTLGQDIDRALSAYGLQLRQGDVYLNRLGAEQLNAQPGDLLEIFIGPIPVPYRVKAIVDESGPLGALTPVVMLDVSEAQQLLFMPGRINNVLVSNQGDELSGIALTDTVVERLQRLSLNESRAQEALAAVRAEPVASMIQARAATASNPVVQADDAPDFLVNFIEELAGATGFEERIQALANALAAEAGPESDEQILTALANPAVREWILELPLARENSEQLSTIFSGLDDFEVLSPLTKQFAVNVANAGGIAFGSMFSIFGFFSIFAGVLLIFLIFVMLAAERRSELGIARAVGMQRSHVVTMFVTEGLIYDLAAALLGLGLGVLVSYGMIGFLSVLLENVSRQVSGQTNPFRLWFAVTPDSLVIAYSLGVLLTFFVVTLASWNVSRLNIVSAIRNLPDSKPARRNSRLRTIVRESLAPLVLAAGVYTIVQAQELGNTMTLIGITLTLLGGALTVDRLLVRTSIQESTRQRIVYSAIGVGLLIIWALPWTTLTGSTSSLFSQNPTFLLLSFVLSGPLIILGAILVVMFSADTLARLATRLLGGFSSLTPALRTAIAYPLSTRFRTGVTMLLFAMVITTVTIMSVVIQATQIVSTPDEQRTAGFEIDLAPGLLSFFDPVTDIAQEAAVRADFPSQEIAAIGSVSGLRVDARQVNTPSSWESVRLVGIDAGYTSQASRFYHFHMRASGYDSDEAVWQALAQRDDVAIVTRQRVAGGMAQFGDEFEEEHRFRRLRLSGFTVDDPEIPPVQIEVQFTQDGQTVTRTVQVIGVLEENDTLAGGTVQVNRAVLDALNGEPVRPEHFYVKVAPGADVRTVAQQLERSMLNSGMNATVLAEKFAAGQAVTRGILSLLQGFLGLGLVVGIAALGVISSRTVVERRQQVGVLRAIGYQPGMVALSFILESSFIAITGIVIGAATGIALGEKMIGQFYTLATDQAFPIPWLSIAGMLLLAYLFSLATTILPAYRASRIYPADALRYE